MLFRRTLLLAVAAHILLLGEAKELSLAEQQLQKLTTVRTLHIEDLVGEGSQAIRDLLVSAIHARGIFVLVEDPVLADAYVRGSAEDLIYTEAMSYRSGINVRGAASSSRRENGESDFGSASFGVGDTEDSSRRERRHEALVAVRVVLSNGEVVWAATRESSGAKFRGAAADVAYGIADELNAAVTKARMLGIRPD